MEIETCPDCDCLESPKPELKEQRFMYGIGNEAVELSAMVIVHSCPNCGFAFTDGTAEEVRENAINDYKRTIK